MIIECSGHLIFVTTNNCNTFTILYGLKVTTATYMYYVLTFLCLVTAFENDDSACCLSPSLLAGLPLGSVSTTSTNRSSALGIILQVRSDTRKKPSRTAPLLLRHSGKCLLARCLAMHASWRCAQSTIPTCRR
jgi:hypothetical protein